MECYLLLVQIKTKSFWLPAVVEEADIIIYLAMADHIVVEVVVVLKVAMVTHKQMMVVLAELKLMDTLLGKGKMASILVMVLVVEEVFTEAILATLLVLLQVVDRAILVLPSSVVREV